MAACVVGYDRGRREVAVPFGRQSSVPAGESEDGKEEKEPAILVVTGDSTASICAELEKIRAAAPLAFAIVRSDVVSGSARGRLDCYASGARMLANDDAAVDAGIARAMAQWDASFPEGAERYMCPTCGMDGLSEDALHLHYPLYHTTELTPPCDCPICGRKAGEYRAFAIHLHNEHGPVGDREPHFPDFNAFSWVVCRRPQDGKLLLVHEPAAIAGGKPNYWFPAGRVDEGETFVEAGKRETEEEGGVSVDIKGVLLVKLGGGVVPRIVLYAEPRLSDDGGGVDGGGVDGGGVDGKDDAGGAAQGGGGEGGEGRACDTAKSIPDFESCGAGWVDVSELDALDDTSDYRSRGTADLLRSVASGVLEPLPIDTPSFRGLEEMVVRLTSSDGEDDNIGRWLEEIGSVWGKLAEEYPADRLQHE
jgi:8-oxo-dGTP pyrophosphatase MutT (NUDIX family)